VRHRNLWKFFYPYRPTPKDHPNGNISVGKRNKYLAMVMLATTREETASFA